MADHVAHAETEISASPDQVWDALTDPEAISRFMFGSQVDTDWQVGSPITWTGEYDGTSFTDKGEILQVDAPERLRLTHYSPMTGEPDEPESYHTLDYRLARHGGRHAAHPGPGRQRLRGAGRAVRRQLADHARPGQGVRRGGPRPPALSRLRAAGPASGAEPAQPQAVADDEERGAGHRGPGHHRVEHPGRSERDRGDVVGEGPEEVAPGSSRGYAGRAGSRSRRRGGRRRPG